METGPPPSQPRFKSAERIPTPPLSRSGPIIHTGHLCISKLGAAPGEPTGSSLLFVMTRACQNKEITGSFWRNNCRLMTKCIYKEVFCFIASLHSQYVQLTFKTNGRSLVHCSSSQFSEPSRPRLLQLSQGNHWVTRGDPTSTSQQNHQNHYSIKESSCSPTVFSIIYQTISSRTTISSSPSETHLPSDECFPQRGLKQITLFMFESEDPLFDWNHHI